MSVWWTRDLDAGSACAWETALHREEAQALIWGKAWRSVCFSEKAGETGEGEAGRTGMCCPSLLAGEQSIEWGARDAAVGALGLGPHLPRHTLVTYLRYFVLSVLLSHFLGGGQIHQLTSPLPGSVREPL